MKVSSDMLGKKLGEILTKYGNDVTEVVRQSVKKTGTYAANKLKEVSPKKTGAYAKGWKSGEYTWTALGAHVTVHNAKKPGLAHLLENGHALRNGGRAPAHVHIKPIEDEAKDILENTVIKEIRNA